MPIATRSLLAVSLTLGLAASAVAAPPADDVHVVTARRTFDAAGLPTRNAQAWRDSLGRDLVVARLDPAGLAALGRHVHEVEHRCGGFFAFGSRAEAEAFVSRDRSAAARPSGVSYTIDNHATVDAWLPQVDAANLHATIASLSAFHNRHYASPTGREAALWIRDSWQALAAGRSDVEVELFEDCAMCSTQPSVILTVRGSELPDEIVVVGGHLDSINWDEGGDSQAVAPGADDDASGIATISEIIRVALAGGWQPQRTVKFMGYAAEEVGLYGSDAIAQRFRADGADVVGVLQLDMTNYKTDAPYDLQIITDNSDPALLAYFGELFDAYLAPLGLVRSPLECGYGCSDHASWSDAGYPAGMVFEAGRERDPNDPWDLGDFPYIHTAGDTLANMDDSTAHSVKFAQFGLAFVGELAKTHDDDGIFGDGFDGQPVAAQAGPATSGLP